MSGSHNLNFTKNPNKNSEKILKCLKNICSEIKIDKKYVYIAVVCC